MAETSLWGKPIVKGIRYASLTLFFSYLPTLVVCIVYWAKNHHWPDFAFLFNSGGMISIWIPILAMLIISLYEIREHKMRPFWEEIVLIVAFVMVLVLTTFFTLFFFNVIQYDRWVKLVSYVVIVFLLCSLCFSRYLECRAPEDLQTTRTKDQDMLKDKLSKIK